MNIKLLGKSNVQVSELCLGTMYFGTTVKKNQAFEILDAFVEAGGNFIDTANNYCYWNGGTGDESEMLIGKWLKERANRDHLILASKIGARPLISNSDQVNLEGLKKETILKAVDESLKRLGVESLDLCYIHADLQQYPLEERLEALSILETQGKIRLKGCSNISKDRFTESEELNKANSFSSFQTLQQKFSYLLPNKIEEDSILKFVNEDLISCAESRQISLLTYSVLLSGSYSRNWESMPEEYKSKRNEELFKEMIRGAKEIGCTNSQWVLRWVMNQSENIIPLIAASSLKQLDENLGALKFTMN
jgi:aryl-alcohol dehydrogenase-like predicted oxidoreductase